MASELSQKTVLAWRAFVKTPAFSEGIMHLRISPSVRGKTAEELLVTSLKWGAYQEALDDLTDVLAHVPEKEKSLEEPGLE